MNESARQAQGRVRLQRVLFSVFPGNPRCFTCNAPLSGSGATLIGLTGIRSSSFNPQLCNQCESIARDHEGGAEVKLTMLFADVRGSTPLSISNSPTQYSELIRNFYRVSSELLIKRNALVNRLVGDQVIGLFVPRLAGADHAYQAIETGRDILQAAESEKSGVPVVPFGIGIHTGIAYVGSIGASEGVNEIAVLGDSANIAARLSSAAGPGELIVSEAAALEAELNDDEWDTRQLNLKGVHGAINVRVAQIISEVASDL
jgi:adenylate cyclase